MSSILFVHGISVDALIGVRAEEQGRRQTLLVDVDVRLQMPDRDQIEATVDYRKIVQIIEALAGDEHTHLIETFAQRVAHGCLGMPFVKSVVVTVRKPAALAPAMAGITLERGANDREDH